MDGIASGNDAVDVLGAPPSGALAAVTRVIWTVGSPLYDELPIFAYSYRASSNGVTTTPQAKSLRRKGSTMEWLVTSLGEVL